MKRLTLTLTLALTLTLTLTLTRTLPLPLTLTLTRQLGLLITAFIRKMSFGRDLEAHLNFFVECRANFANLDAVLDTLVMGATRCAMPTHAAGPKP